MGTPGTKVSAEHRREMGNRFAVRAAIMAPSIHNTQPWQFASREDGICLYADFSRHLPRTDPAGRELVISCGAASMNLQLAMRHLGFAADVRLLPDIRRPDMLVEATWGHYRRKDRYEDSLFHAMSRRHTHYGPFVLRPMPPMLMAELAAAAHAESASLMVVAEAAKRRLLAELIRGAEMAESADPEAASELARWVAPPRSGRVDGVPARTGQVEPVAFADRGFLLGNGRMPMANPGPHVMASGFGTAVLLTTRGDRRLDWILAGRALQRVLLHAAIYDVSAAFHTQALELPGPRSKIQAEIAAGAHPQVLLRLGYASSTRATPRRPVTDVLAMGGQPDRMPRQGLVTQGAA